MRWAFLVAMGLAAATPASAQNRPPSYDLNLGVLGETGAIAPVQPHSHLPAWSRYGAPDRAGRPSEPPLSHMPVTPSDSRWRH